MGDFLSDHPVFVLDTSVILKWFRQGEVLAPQALSLRDDYLDGLVTIAVPSLVAYELANVLRYKKDLATDQVQEAVGTLFDLKLEIIYPSGALLRRSVEIARMYETTVYDAVFAALAEGMNAAFVTADDLLARRLEALPIVHSLDEVPS